MVDCPNCRGSNLGKIGLHAYYCWNCYIEVVVDKNKINLHQIEMDGSLSPLNDLFTEEERSI
ncbi:hypothetical protein [Oceanobacillus sp. CAU 1775]